MIVRVGPPSPGTAIILFLEYALGARVFIPSIIIIIITTLWRETQNTSTWGPKDNGLNLDATDEAQATCEVLKYFERKTTSVAARIKQKVIISTTRLQLTRIEHSSYH